LIHAAPVILLLPALGFGILAFGGRRIGDPLAGWIGTLAVAGSFVASVLTFLAVHSHPAGARTIVQTYYSWVPVGGLRVNVGVLLDPLSMTMVLFVTGVSALIHLYSIGYMKGDPQYRKFFVYLNLFVFSMVVLVMGANFLFTFVGWEGVGTCSYLLVAFWFDRETAATAGKKAFVVNRIGDFGFLLAMFLIFQHTGRLDYLGVFSHLGTMGGTTLTAVALLLFLGAVGKSAQIPLYVWLPDAMEGPTPVSALIHAATMVTAGVYLMTRINPIMHLTPVSSTVVAAIGAATALLAATIACAQDDIKRVLAYSTVSQLGYMFLGVGATGYGVAVFHMVSHAFFKALLFLGAGAVIHAMADEQDMKGMGGLRRYMPITTVTFGIAWLAISGIPPFNGFWSKDGILAAAYDKNRLLWLIGVVTVALTAYYMTRQMVLVFAGQARWSEARPAVGGAHGGHGDHHGEPHDGPWVMSLPLVVLGVATVAGLALDLPFSGLQFLDRWLDPVVGPATRPVVANLPFKWNLAGISVALALVGMATAARLWSARADRPELEPAVLRNKWYVDEAYSGLFFTAGGALSRFTASVVDNRIVDGAVNGVGALARGSGSLLRRLQTGYVRNYALAISVGAVLILGFMLSRAGG